MLADAPCRGPTSAPGLGDMVAVQMGILEGDESSSLAEVVG